MSRRSSRTWSIFAVVVIVGCGRSVVTRDGEGSEGSGGESGSGGDAGASGAGATSGAAAGATTGGATSTGGSSSGRGGAGGTVRGGTSNAGEAGLGPGDCDLDDDGVTAPSCGGEDCEDEDPTIPDPNDSNAQTDSWRPQTIDQLGGGVGLAVDAYGAAHVAVAMHGQVRYLINGALKHVLLADVHPASEVRLTLDSNGEPRILFGGLGSPITFAIRRKGVWQMRQLDSDGLPVSVLVGPNDQTILGYVEDPLAGQRLHLAVGYNVDLTPHTLDGPTSAALAVGPGGELHVVWPNSAGALEYDVLDIDTNSSRHETIPSDVASPPIGLSWSGLVVDGAGVPGLGIIVDDAVVYLVRDPTWRRVEIPSPSNVSEAFVALDEDGFAHLLLSAGADHLAFLSQGLDGWTDEDIWFFDPPRGFALDRFGVAHAVVEAEFARTYITNRDIVPDSIDRDCDGVDGFDRDGDGHASIITGGDDCDDNDGEIHPDQDDFHGDGVDSDCDGFGHCPDALPGPPFVEVPYGNRGFCMDATEVTHVDYAVFLASGGAPPPSRSVPSFCQWNDTFEPPPLGTPAASGGTCPGFLPETMIPITCVDWCDAWAYCAWTGKRLCGASFGQPITDPTESVWRIACDSGLRGIGDYGAVWEWQDGCTNGTATASDPCPAYGGRATTAPPPDRCNEALSLARADVSDVVGFRCCDL